MRGGTKRRFSLSPHISYREFITDCNYFVDNSWLIGELLNYFNTIYLVTAPRKCGKTLNALMVKEFLEIEVDEFGKRIRQKDSKIFQLFRLGEVFYKGELDKMKLPLLIKAARFDPKYFRGVPVIFLNFTYHGDVNCLGDIVISIEEQVRLMYSHHKYLQHVLANTNKIQGNSTILLKRWHTYANLRGGAPDDAEKALYFLSILLHEYFDEAVYILIDDYDSYFRKMFAQGIPEEEGQRVVGFFWQFYRRIFTFNPCLRGAMVTGVVPLILNDYCLGSNETLVHTVLNGTLMTYYGISLSHVRGLLKKFKRKNDTIEQTVTEYYGYEMGPMGVYKMVNIYSFAQFLTTTKTKFVHCLQVDDVEWVFDILPKFRWLYEALVELVAGNRLLVGGGEIQMRAEDYLRLGNFVNSTRNEDMESNFVRYEVPGLVIRCLLAYGYLTQTNEPDDRCNVTKLESTFVDETLEGNVTVRITNREVREIFKSRLDEFKCHKEWKAD